MYVESKPSSLPDDQFATFVFEDPQEYGFTLEERLYEHAEIRYPTTTSGEVVVLPHISYPNFCEYTRPPQPSGFLARMKYAVRERRELRAAESAGFDATTKVYFPNSTTLSAEYLSDSQQSAIDKAEILKILRYDQSPLISSFSYLRRMNVDGNNQLYVCSEREGNGLDQNMPAAAVRSAAFIGDIDFATATQGHRAMFRYYQPDVSEFIPMDMSEAEPNAYSFIDEQRNVITTAGSYQIARLRLFRVETDTNFPLTSLNLPPATIG